MEERKNIFWKDISKLTMHVEQIDRFLQTGYIDPLSMTSKSGDIVRFGTYSWIVLNKDEEEGTFFLFACRLLAINPMKYHKTLEGVTWETSDIREYLNNAFFSKFCSEDKEKIIETNVSNRETPWFTTNGGNDTVDKIFLLSLDEIAAYMGDSGQLSKKSWPHDTPVDKTKPCLITDEYCGLHSAKNEFGENFRYWLRSAGRDETSAAIIREDGTIDLGGDIINTTAGVRPAMWVKL
ncbi:MAG: DUF6273 domain-containing protein [Lachnospiraceae bacterium]|nr:DUF6273 domain-containing protein [Lachnospiraceae bacterium]